MLCASHIAGRNNFEADYASSYFNECLMLELKYVVFNQLCCWFDQNPEVDLFASRSNNKLRTYASGIDVY